MASTMRLGCVSDTQVFITDQCGAPKICELTDVATISWNRVLDDISEATVTVPISDADCCACMALIEPWCHEMHIIRNGEVVWQGPVVKVIYGFQQVTVHAQDVMAWTKVRVPQLPFDNTATGGQEMTDVALQVLKLAFAEHNPCVLEYILQTDLGHRPTLYNKTQVSTANGFPAFQGYIHDWIQNLAQNGLDYTVLGRRIILSAENPNIEPLGILSDEHIMGEIEVAKDGFAMGNRVFVRYQDDDKSATCVAQNPALSIPPYTACPALSEATGLNSPKVDPATGKPISCYGPIERITTDGTPFNYITAKQTADGYISFGSVAPRTVDLSNGTRLSPDTPWGINDMVPGQRIDVAFTQLCLEVFQHFRLLEVQYQLDPSGDEQISISLGPTNQFGSV